MVYFISPLFTIVIQKMCINVSILNDTFNHNMFVRSNLLTSLERFKTLGAVIFSHWS